MDAPRSWRLHLVCGSREIKSNFRVQSSLHNLRQDVENYLTKLRFFPNNEVAAFNEKHKAELIVWTALRKVVLFFTGCETETYRGRRMSRTALSQFIWVKRTKKLSAALLTLGGVAALVWYLYTRRTISSLVRAFFEFPRSKVEMQTWCVSLTEWDFFTAVQKNTHERHQFILSLRIPKPGKSPKPRYLLTMTLITLGVNYLRLKILPNKFEELTRYFKVDYVTYLGNTLWCKEGCPDLTNYDSIPVHGESQTVFEEELARRRLNTEEEEDDDELF